MSERVGPAGISAAELTRIAVAQVGYRTADALTPQQLGRWLVEQRLAVRRNGRLEPTALGRELGAAFNPLQGA